MKIVTILVLLGYANCQDDYVFRVNNVPKIFPKDLGVEICPLPNEENQHFIQLGIHAELALIGSNNALYAINLNNLNETSMLYKWEKSDKYYSFMCHEERPEYCSNYIRLAVFPSPNKIFICGTNAGAPRCRFTIWMKEDKSYRATEEIAGYGIIPQSPEHLFTYTYSDEQLFVGSPITFHTKPGHIYSTIISSDEVSQEFLRTSSFGDMNDAVFVTSFEYGEHIYYIFRENSVEKYNSLNPSSRYRYSRIGRICKNDVGNKGNYITFLKVRLSCGSKGKYNIRSDVIESAKFVDTTIFEYKPSWLFMIFSTPEDSLTFSTLCMSQMSEITALFEGNFYRTSNSEDEILISQNIKSIQRGFCPSNSSFLSENDINFLRNNRLVTVNSSFFMEHLPLKIIYKKKFIKLTVSPGVMTINGLPVKMVFILTEDNQILKIKVDLTVPKHKRLTLVARMNLPKTYQDFVNFDVFVKSNGEHHLLLVMRNAVVTIPAHHCSKIDSCEKCVAKQDPYCAWHKVEGKCRTINTDEDRSNFSKYCYFL